MSFAGVLQGVYASGSFYPSSIANLVLDLDGDKGLTTTNVNRLFDATPNAHTATQDASSKRPSLVENDSDFNGHNSISFDGVNDFLTAPDSADFELGTGLTIYMMMTSVKQAGFTIPLAKRQSSATDMSWFVRMESTGGLRFYTRNAANTATYPVIRLSTTDGDGTPRIFRMRHAAGVENGIRVDNDVETTAAAPDEIASSASTLNVMTLNNGSTANIATGKIARILIYKESIADGSTADLAIMAELDALYKGVGTSTGLDFGTEGNLVADFNPDTGAGLATTAWADQSGGTAHDAAQASAARQPALLLSDASFNGHGSVTFDGTNDNMRIADHADLEAPGGITIYVVGSVASVPATAMLVTKHSGGATDREWMLRYDVTTDKARMLVRNSTDTAWASSLDGVGADGLPHVVRGWFDEAQVGTRVDAAETLAAATSSRPAASPVTLASTSGNTSLCALTTPRILIYSRAVTAAEDAKIMAYLNARYGI